MRAVSEFNRVWVAIVDDHPVFRLGLRQALRAHKGIDVLWDAATAEEALRRLAEAPVDIVLMDVSLESDRDGIEATRQVVRRWPDVSVVMLSAGLDDRVKSACMAAGALAYLPKHLTPEEIVRAVRQLAAERHAPAMALAGPAIGARASHGLQSLTRRELEVLEAMRLGHTNQEIANYLGLSRQTVNKHVHEILKKLNARNRVQAVTTVAGSNGSR